MSNFTDGNVHENTATFIGHVIFAETPLFTSQTSFHSTDHSLIQLILNPTDSNAGMQNDDLFDRH